MRLTYRTSAASAFADSKPHYAILDGLRGVAALTVIWYHVFEGFATSPLDQKFNHGYLAVDFFFILSGFVVGYAYDDRWAGRRAGGGMRMRDFLKRRIVRLHPMVVLGSVLGAVCVTCIFPVLVYMGASGRISEGLPMKVCRFLGDISYPVYIIHYPFMYLFYAWTFTGVPFSTAWPWAVAVFAGSIVLAYILLKVYDDPLRRWLGSRIL